MRIAKLRAVGELSDVASAKEGLLKRLEGGQNGKNTTRSHGRRVIEGYGYVFIRKVVP